MARGGVVTCVCACACLCLCLAFLFWTISQPSEDGLALWGPKRSPNVVDLLVWGYGLDLEIKRGAGFVLVRLLLK